MTTATDLIPLESIENGLGHSHMFWIRTGCIGWCISFVFMHQRRDFITQLPMRLVHLVIVATFVSVGTTVFAIALSQATGRFPLPCYEVLCVPGWLASLAIGIFVAWGRYFRGNQIVQRQFIRYTFILSVQVTMTLVYPAYIFAFKQFAGGAQVAVACLLPILKLMTKNALNLLLPDVEDGKPEFIIFNVEIFHALYVPCCMQSTASYHTTVVLTVIDFVFAIKSLVGIWASAQDAKRIVLSHRSVEGNRGSNATAGAIIASVQPRTFKLQLVEVTMYLVETYPALLPHDTIREQPRHCINISNIASTQAQCPGRSTLLIVARLNLAMCVPGYRVPSPKPSLLFTTSRHRRSHTEREYRNGVGVCGTPGALIGVDDRAASLQAARLGHATADVCPGVAMAVSADEASTMGRVLDSSDPPAFWPGL